MRHRENLVTEIYIDSRAKDSTIIRRPLFRYFVNIPVRFLRLSFKFVLKKRTLETFAKRRSEAQRITHYAWYCDNMTCYY